MYKFGFFGIGKNKNNFKKFLKKQKKTVMYIWCFYSNRAQ